MGEEIFVTGCAVQSHHPQNVVTVLPNPPSFTTSTKDSILANAKAMMYELVIVEDIFPD